MNLMLFIFGWGAYFFSWDTLWDTLLRAETYGNETPKARIA